MLSEIGWCGAEKLESEIIYKILFSTFLYKTKTKQSSIWLNNLNWNSKTAYNSIAMYFYHTVVCMWKLHAFSYECICVCSVYVEIIKILCTTTT